eukprot:5901872-Pleurochrysis_carterae.AAC.2
MHAYSTGKGLRDDTQLPVPQHGDELIRRLENALVHTRAAEKAGSLAFLPCCFFVLAEAQRVSLLAVLHLTTQDGLVCAIELEEVVRIDAAHVVVHLELAGCIWDLVVANVAVLFEELKAPVYNLALQTHCPP